jgi:hypothetical protein
MISHKNVLKGSKEWGGGGNFAWVGGQQEGLGCQMATTVYRQQVISLFTYVNTASSAGPRCVMGRSRFPEGLRNLVKWINGKNERNFKNEALKKIVLYFSFSLGHFNLEVSRHLFISCLFSRLCINLFADVTPAPCFLQYSAGPRQIVCDLPMTQRGSAEEADVNI